LLIDADSTIPNLALMKLSKHYKNIGFGVDLVTNLEPEIEQLQPDYTIYPENDTSYGFITRGCIRNCYFCKVPKKEGSIRQVNDPKDIIQHKKVKFMDNNILALPNHREILEELIHLRVKCEFNQGLDLRLITEENSELLSELNYLGRYTFAFDDAKYISVIEKQMKLLSWRKDWQVRFFCYVNPEMKIEDTLFRLEWMKENKCLPYVMRDISCWNSPKHHFYVSLASWANQIHLWQSMPFCDFVNKRYSQTKHIQRNKDEIEIYNSALENLKGRNDSSRFSTIRFVQYL
jgi:hypothetical protein